MNSDDAKADLRRYLQINADALLWKLDGLSEYDVHRPLTPTGTNLLGLVKHVAGVTAGYLGLTFGRPFPEPLAWAEDDAEPNADMWATPDESRDDIVGIHHRVWAHAFATIDALDLDSVGRVPWWPEDRAEVTLQRVLVHMIGEVARHAGQADIVRETIDGVAGLRADNGNLWEPDGGWEAHRQRVQAAAEAFEAP